MNRQNLKEWFPILLRKLSRCVVHEECDPENGCYEI